MIAISNDITTKLSLCQLSQALHHKVKLTDDGIASYRLSLSTTWRWVFSFTPDSFASVKKPSVPVGKMFCVLYSQPRPCVVYRIFFLLLLSK